MRILDSHTNDITGRSMPDKALFARIAAGDEAAFKTLFETCRQKLYVAILHYTKSPITAEDLTQEAFVRIWRFRESLKDVDNPTAYLYKIIFNLTYTYLRKEANETRIRNLVSQKRNGADNSTAESMEANETARLIAAAVESLPPQQRLVYQLSREKGLTYHEIAAMMQLSPNTVRNHLVEALKHVRSYLKNHALGITALLIEAMFSR